MLASTPSHAPALKLHAWLCGQVYNTSGSLGALRTLLTHDSYDWEAWYRLANTLSASDGEGALSVVRSAIDLSAGTDGANDPLAAPTVTSVTRSYSVMQLLMLESALTETVDGAESALERHVELFAFFAGQIWRSAAFARAVQGLQFEGAHREVLADDAHSYPLKASGSEGALSGLSGLSGQAQLRRDGSISRNSLGSTPSSHTHSSRRKSKLHLPHPHMHLGLSVGGALGRLRKPRGAQGVQNTQSTHNTHNTHSAEKALPRIRVSSVPDSATGTQHSSHTDVATDTRTNSNSNSNNNSNRNSNALGRPALELSEYASHERSLLVALWVMSAATYRRARDWENAAHALHMAEEAGEMGEMGEMCGVYIEVGWYLARVLSCYVGDMHTLTPTLALILTLDSSPSNASNGKNTSLPMRRSSRRSLCRSIHIQAHTHTHTIIIYTANTHMRAFYSSWMTQWRHIYMRT